MNEQDALELLAAFQQGEFKDAGVEVKRARGGITQRLYEAISAFANRPGGGVILLGLDEGSRFTATGIEDVQALLSSLTDMSAKMSPPVSLDSAVVKVDGNKVIVAEVPECDYRHKPCHYKPSGMQTGSFLRVGNQTRRMSAYEIFSFLEGQGQPVFDRQPVSTAKPEDLDPDLLQTYLEGIRKYRNNIWQRLRLTEKSLQEQLLALDILTQTEDGIYPTLAGLLVFGTWPQKFYPSLMISFVRYPGLDAAGKGPRGERFLDNAQFEGPLTGVIEQAVKRCGTFRNINLVWEACSLSLISVDEVSVAP
jgi:ATP-dependent DNA helicase RecG